MTQADLSRPLLRLQALCRCCGNWAEEVYAQDEAAAHRGEGACLNCLAYLRRPATIAAVEPLEELPPAELPPPPGIRKQVWGLGDALGRIGDARFPL